MKISFHKNFEKQYKKLRLNAKRKFKERKDIFLTSPFDQILNNHPLRGKYKGYRSINVTGNVRAIYRLVKNDIAIFVAIDTHSNLYN